MLGVGSGGRSHELSGGERSCERWTEVCRADTCGGRGEEGEREEGEGGREMEQVSYSSVEISYNDNNVCSGI